MAGSFSVALRLFVICLGQLGQSVNVVIVTVSRSFASSALCEIGRRHSILSSALYGGMVFDIFYLFRL